MKVIDSLKKRGPSVKKAQKPLRPSKVSEPSLFSECSRLKKVVDPYLMPITQAMQSVSSHVLDHWTAASLYIDIHTYPGATQEGQRVLSRSAAAVSDAACFAVSSTLSLPMNIQAITNVSWANLNLGHTIGAIPKTEDGKRFKLYRAITGDELLRFVKGRTGPLFDVPGSPERLGFWNVLRHVLGVRVRNEDRLLTSFSVSKDLAYKFASTRRIFGAVAEFEVPVDVVDRFAWCGLTIHREILLPTKVVSLNMLSRLEIRKRQELKAAKERELWASLHAEADLFASSHRFDGPPFRSANIKNKAESDAFRVYLRRYRFLLTRDRVRLANKGWF
jgi:hypothetical protein